MTPPVTLGVRGMKYKAVRPWYGDEGMVRKGQVLDLDPKRAQALGALVTPAEEAPAPSPAPVEGAKAAPVPENKMDAPPENKAAPVPRTKRAVKE